MYNSIAILIGNSLKDTFGVSKEVTLVLPEDPAHGDLTTSVCLQVGKEIGKSPREVAAVLQKALKGIEDIEKVEIAGPGFLNLTLTIAARLKQLLRAQAACEPEKKRTEAPVIIEYSHPNIAKPLGVHHLLSTVIGQALVNLYRHLGYNVVAWNYIGDWGTQFGKLAVAREKWGRGKAVKDFTLDELLELYVRFHEEAEKNPSLEEEGRSAFRRLEQGDAALRAFWQEVVDLSLRNLHVLYERLHVSFDITKGESAYEQAMAPILEEGKNKGVFVSGKDGALVVEFPEGENLPVFLILKSDGGTLYSTRDLALARDRKDVYKAQAVLHIVDVAQQLYFQQLFATMEKLHWSMEHEKHIVYGRMSFPDKEMSTRKGNIISLEDALDEAVRRADALIAEKESEVSGREREELAEMMGTGAFVYTILSQNRKQNMVFTWERALTFEGNSGPYIQYTHARARSVLRKGKVQIADLPKKIDALEESEYLLMRHLAQFPLVMEEARSDAMPHKLAQYLYGLSREFNSLYNALPILDAPEPKRSLRIALTALTADILKVGAELLTLRVPEQM